MPAPTLPRRAEHVVTGRVLDLPLVERAAIVRSQSASRITWHRHRRFEMLLLVDGATAYEFADGRTVEIPGGHFLVVPPEARHRGVHDIRRPAKLCGLLFDPRPRSAGKHTPLAPGDLRRLAATFAAGALRPCPMNVELRRLAGVLARQLTNFDRRDPGAVVELRLTLCAALVEAARQLTAPRIQEPTTAVRAAQAFLDANFGRQFGMHEVAAAAGCSRARLFHIFKQSTGLTPNDYLLRVRIARAQEALERTNAPVTQVAMACGFSTSQYFSNVFRKYTGQTPSAFRGRDDRREVSKSVRPSV